VVSLTGQSGFNYGLQFSEDSRYLHSFNDSKFVTWDWKTNSAKTNFNFPTSNYREVAMNADLSTVICGDLKKITVWNMKNRTAVLTLGGHFAPATSVVFSSDSKKLFSAAWENPIRVFDTQSGLALKPIPTEGRGSWQEIQFRPNSQQIVLTDWSKTVNLFDTEERALKKNYNGFDDYVYSVALHPNGQEFVVYSQKKGVYEFYSFDSDRPIRVIREPQTKGIRVLKFSADGRDIFISSGSYFGFIQYDAKSWKPIQFFSLQGGLLDISLNRNSTVLATLSVPSRVSIWDIKTSKLIRSFESVYAFGEGVVLRACL
jgi:WD40 repeat protein